LFLEDAAELGDEEGQPSRVAVTSGVASATRITSAGPTPEPKASARTPSRALSAIASVEEHAECARAAGHGSPLAVAARVIPVLHRALDRVGSEVVAGVTD